MYGIQFFNSNSEEIFSSDNEYLKVVKMGTVSLSDMEVKTITFDPVSIKPKLFINSNWYYDEAGGASINHAYIIKPLIGNLSTDSNGDYNSVEIGMIECSQTVYSGSIVPKQPIISTPWEVSYMIFI